MALLPIISLPDPRLRLVSEPVAEIDAAVRKLMDDMLETMYDAPGIGLAAIQVAVPRRVLVIDIAKPEDGPKPICIANPEIVWASDVLSVYEEGCLSIPEYYEEVERPDRVRVRYLDREGKTQELEADGLLATALQHEIDHLNGVLFIDHISRLKRERVVRKFSKVARRSTSDRPEA
ncbi:MAG: peptide deformylase [Hyphomicrobiales bacterium]|nr:peptide deformylase [Hyphomicrobiales bacterium]